MIMNENEIEIKYAALLKKLKIDCEKCSGLCCVALYCTKTDGFPANKEAGIPCKNLMHDYRCNIHSELADKNMRGCLAYDCFGAGQKVTQGCYPNVTWETHHKKANEIFEVFLIVFQLHQMEWYLLESLYLITDKQLQAMIEALISENEQITNQPTEEILKFDNEKYRLKVNQVLKQVSDMITIDSDDEAHSKDYFGRNFKKVNLNAKNFSMTLMIAANLEGCSLQGTNFLGADIRDANIKNTDLSSCLFLTQMQINSAKGNHNTKLPKNLSYPDTWQ